MVGNFAGMEKQERVVLCLVVLVVVQYSLLLCVGVNFHLFILGLNE